MKPRPVSANNIPNSSVTRAATLDTMTAVEPLEQQKLRKRVDVTISVMEKTCLDAMQSKDTDEKINLFTKAKPLCENALKMLESLPRTDDTIKTLETQTKNRAQIALELTSAFLTKRDATSNIDSKIEYALLAAEEIKDTLVALHRLPTSKIPPKIIDERKRLKTQIKIDLMMQCATSARETTNSDEKKKLYSIALDANRAIQDELKQLPGSAKDKKNLIQNYLWNEWAIQVELESVLYGELIATQNIALEMMGKFAFVKEKSNIPPQLTKDFQDKIEALSANCEASHSLQQDLYEKCTSLLGDKVLFASTTDKNRQRCSEVKEATRTKLALCAVMDSQFKTALAFERLDRMRENASSETLHFALNWIGENDKKLSLLIGAFDSVINPTPAKKAVAPSDSKKCEILSSLIEQLTEIEVEAKWMADLFQNKEMPTQDIEQFIVIARCSKQLIDAAKFELELIQATIATEKKSEPDLQAPQSSDALQINSNQISPSNKTTSTIVSEIANINIKEDGETQVINTRFDGKLMGRREGNFVVAENIKKESVKYRQDGELWVRHEKEDDEIDANIHELEQELKEQRRQEKSLQKIFRQLDKAENTVAEKSKNAEEYIKLSNYSEKYGAPFSQTIGIFKLALYQQEKAMSVLNKFISKLEAKTFQNEEVNNRLNELKRLRQVVKNETHNIRTTKINAIKNQPPSGPLLNFLLEENQVSRVVTTLEKKKLKGAEISSRGFIPDDFMDEHEIHIHGLAQPLVLHTHYRKEHAAIEEKTASHLKYRDTNGIDTRSPVSLNVLKKVYAFNTENAGNHY